MGSQSNNFDTIRPRMRLLCSFLSFCLAHNEFDLNDRTTPAPDPDNDDGWTNFVKLYGGIKKKFVKIEESFPEFFNPDNATATLDKKEVKQLRNKLFGITDIIENEGTYGDRDHEEDPYTGPTEWHFLTNEFRQIQKGQIAGYVNNSDHYELSFKLKVGTELPENTELTSVIQVGDNTEADRFPGVYLMPGYKNVFQIAQAKSYKFLKYEHVNPKQWVSTIRVKDLSKNSEYNVVIRKSSYVIRLFFNDVAVGHMNCYGVPAMDHPDEQPIRIGVDADHEVDYPSAGHFEIGHIVYKRLEAEAPKPTSEDTLQMYRLIGNPTEASTTARPATHRIHRKRTNWINWRSIFG